ncbi:HAD hydrolase-like protein, partial [Vibrio parahaemolyticus]
YRRDSDWRKPHSGMMRQAIADLGLDPAKSWAVGDKPRDLEAAAGAQIANL